MIQILSLKLNPDDAESTLSHKVVKMLHIQDNDLLSLKIIRKSIDARDGIHFVYAVAVSVKNETSVLKRNRSKNVSIYHPLIYQLPCPVPPRNIRPVVVGAGPAGLFAALILARCGLPPILLERGKNVENRMNDVEAFWSSSVFDVDSNVQFGEGGAGAFSDGKLNTGTKDIRHRFILETLVQHGAPESILYDAKPHVGTDYLHRVLLSVRSELISLGTDIRFSHRLSDIVVRDGRLSSLLIHSPSGDYSLPTSSVILALGHSARDTVEMLYGHGVLMEAKPFAVGVRIEHRQKDIDAVQYKQYAGHPCLPASTYKLSCHLPNGRSAFSFCVCPGGQVIAATSETDQVVTNGMSKYARNLENINGALLVNVTPEDFPSSQPLSGIVFQRQLEKNAFQLGGGSYHAPCQRVEDFLLRRPTEKVGAVHPSYLPAVRYTDLHLCLPEFVTETIALALPELDKKIKGYASPDALLTAVESRSSSPVRFYRDAGFESNIRGLYPCGEGAGFAGGIMSAAADGIKIAEQIIGGAQK